MTKPRSSSLFAYVHAENLEREINHPKPIQLSEWREFEQDLRSRLKAQSFTRMVMFRNFGVDRLDVVLSTGTDRDKESWRWAESGFDHDHDARPMGKSPEEIVYVHRIKTQTTPFTVLNLGAKETSSQEDLTLSYGREDGVSIYDSACLQRAAVNEHWFVKPPLEALLFVYTIGDREDLD